MISITALEFAYSQSPKSSKSLVMAVYLGCIALGNAVTAITNALITNEDGTSLLPGADYYWFFTVLVFRCGKAGVSSRRMITSSAPPSRA